MEDHQFYLFHSTKYLNNVTNLQGTLICNKRHMSQ